MVISGLASYLIIYLPIKNYNLHVRGISFVGVCRGRLNSALPGSFGSDTEFNPRLAEGSGDGEFIIGRIAVVIGSITVVAVFANPLMFMIPPVFANPLIPLVLAMLANPFFTVVEFVKSFDFVLVFEMDRPMIQSGIVLFGVNPLFRPMSTIPVSSAIGPGNSGEDTHQPNNHHTDFQ